MSITRKAGQAVEAKRKAAVSSKINKMQKRWKIILKSRNLLGKKIDPFDLLHHTLHAEYC